ncbi:MAG: NAD-dependent epimerase/dehydratase family protein, partial [Cyclobacteriaceae bacterium]
NELAEKKLPFVAIKREQSNISNSESVSTEWRNADILDINSLHDALEGVDAVIHTAALVSFNAKDRDQLYKVNVEGTKNVVDSCLNLGIPRMVHISSVAAFGRLKGTSEITENQKWVDSKLNSDYAESKYLAELEVFRGQEEGLQIDIINPSVILGQGDWSRSSTQLFNYVWREKPFYTEGSINFVDARDVAAMILIMLNQEASGSRIIANGGNLPLKNLLSQIAIKFSKKPPRIRVPAPLISTAARLETLRSWLTGSTPLVTPQSARAVRENFFYSNQKAIKELGIEFRALEETLDWCCSYYLQTLQ